LNESKIALSTTQSNRTDTAAYLAVNSKLAGIFYVSDAIKDGAKDMITGLRKSGIKNIIMLTGDNPETAKYVADQIGIKDFRANLLPEDKIKIIKEFQKNGTKVAMVGDGINDSPALVQANLGILEGRHSPKRMEMKYEMDRRVYDALILGSETAIETNKTEVKRKRYVTDTGEEEGAKLIHIETFFSCVVQMWCKITKK